MHQSHMFSKEPGRYEIKHSRDRFCFIKSIENHLLISKDFSKNIYIYIYQPLTSQHHLNLSSSNYNIYSSTKINKKSSSSKAFSGPSTCIWWTAVTEGIGRGFGRLRFEGGTRLPSSFQQIIQGARRHGGTRKRSTRIEIIEMWDRRWELKFGCKSLRL